MPNESYKRQNMRVKKFLAKINLMKKTKTLNVREELHARVRIAAATEGVKIEDYASAALTVGLERPKDVTRLLSAIRTSLEEKPGKG